MALSWELSGVPYTSAREAGGIARAIDVLRGAGLAERLRALGVSDAGDLELAAPTGIRGESGLLNEQPLLVLVDAARARVRAARERGHVPLLIGGDCPVLLGALAAIGDGPGTRGLVMLDGHEDAWPPHRSPTGEASDSEVAIALGRVGALPAPLAALVPLLTESGVGLLGPRDKAEIAEAGIPTLRQQVGFFADDAEIGAADQPAEQLMAAALATIEAEAFWLHVDLDVLSSSAFGAVDYPQSGGLDWDTLDRLTATAIGDPRCRGASIVIYNPDLDPTGDAAAQVIEYACRLVGDLSNRLKSSPSTN
jgi:arginase